MSRLVLGFYGSVEHAEEALHEIRKNHFRRSAVVHRAEDGRLKILYAGLSPYSRAAFAIALALALIFLSEVLRTDRWAQILLASVRFSDHLVRHALVGTGAPEENSSTLWPFRASWREPCRCPGNGRAYDGCHRSSEAYRTSVCIRNSSRAAIQLFEPG